MTSIGNPRPRASRLAALLRRAFVRGPAGGATADGGSAGGGSAGGGSAGGGSAGGGSGRARPVRDRGIGGHRVLGTGVARRLGQLYVGLGVYGLSMALMIRSRLGNMPWDVLHQGIAQRTGLDFGWVAIGVGALVLLAWIPLRQRPGLGTISNVLVIGLVADRMLAVLPSPGPIAARVALLVSGIVLNGLASGMYIGASFGPGPRDGLMTGLAARTGRSIRLVRTGIEVVVVVSGAALGGLFGVGTVLYALAIGPLVQLFLPWFTVRRPVPDPRPVSDPRPAALAPQEEPA